MGPLFAGWLPFIFESIVFTLIFILVNLLAADISRRVQPIWYGLVLVLILIVVILLAGYTGGDIGMLHLRHGGL